MDKEMKDGTSSKTSKGCVTLALNLASSASETAFLY